MSEAEIKAMLDGISHVAQSRLGSVDNAVELHRIIKLVQVKKVALSTVPLHPGSIPEIRTKLADLHDLLGSSDSPQFGEVQQALSLLPGDPTTDRN